MRIGCACLLCFCIACRPAAVNDPPSGSAKTFQPEDQDIWYTVDMHGVPCGSMHLTQRLIGNEVQTHSLLDITINRADTKVKITADQSYRETPDGRPLGFKQQITTGQMPLTYWGTVDNGRLTLMTKRGGMTDEKTFPFDPEIKFAWGQLLEQKKHGINPGTRFSIKTYDPDISIDAALRTDFEVFDIEPVDIRGKKKPLFKVLSLLRLKNMDVPTISWVDQNARSSLIDMNVGMVQVRAVESSRSGAAQAADISPEIFLSRLIKVDEKVPGSANGVVLSLSVPRGRNKLPDLPDTGMQRFVRKGDYEATLTINRLNWRQIRQCREEASPGEMASYLQASSILDTNDNHVKQLARTGASSSQKPASRAGSLREFVSDFVDHKGLDVVFATASEVARTRSGDCSEHAVLLAALARASGLPSRAVSGLVQVPSDSMPRDNKNAFGYHMWTQVYLCGQWVDIDAALRQTDCDPTHIALSLLPLNNEGLADSVTPVLPLMGRLQIKIEKVRK